MSKRIIELLKESELLRRRLNNINFTCDSLALRILLIRKQAHITDELNLYTNEEILTATTSEKDKDKTKHKVIFQEIEEQEEETLLDIFLYYVLFKSEKFPMFLELGLTALNREKKKIRILKNK
jgi:hypothetical protein